MISYIIATRNPTNKKLIIIENDDGDVVEFSTEDEAFEASKKTTVCKAWGAEILPLER